MTKRFGSFSRPFLVAFAISILTWVAPPPSQALEISGNKWISDNYGVTVTWDDTWFVADEELGVFDSITLTNGLTYLTFVAGLDSATTSDEVLAGFIAAIRSPSMTTFAPLKDSNGETIRGRIDDRSFAAFSVTETADGESYDYEAYLEGRIIVSGQTSLGLIAYAPAGSLESELPAIRELAESVDVPNTGPVWVEPADEYETLDSGEAAPVFVSGAWRIGIVATILNGEIPNANLKVKAGKEWFVVIADVTNWSDSDSALSLREFELDAEGFSRPLKAAVGSTQRVAPLLGLTAPVGDELMLSINAGETVRVALVYQAPDGSRSHHLSLGDVSLPLADTLQSTLEPELLAEIIGPPELITGEIVSASGGRTVRILFEGESEPQRIRLLGVDLPEEGSCHEDDAVKILEGLAGTMVLVEADAALKETETAARYVWVTIFDGSRSLLNQRLIAEGSVESGSLPRDARFGLWFETTEANAQSAKVGIWGGCESSNVSRNSADPASSPSVATPRPTSTPEA